MLIGGNEESEVVLWEGRDKQGARLPYVILVQLFAETCPTHQIDCRSACPCTSRFQDSTTNSSDTQFPAATSPDK